MDHAEKWKKPLVSGSSHQQVDALMEITRFESVRSISAIVVRLAGGRDDEVRMWAAEALEVAIVPQRAEVSELIEILATADDGECCYWAATLLGRLGDAAIDAVQALESCVSNCLFLPAREQATWALSQIGPAAVAAVPTLREAAEVAPPRLQKMATEAIRIIGDAA